MGTYYSLNSWSRDVICTLSMYVRIYRSLSAEYLLSPSNWPRFMDVSHLSVMVEENGVISEKKGLFIRIRGRAEICGLSPSKAEIKNGKN